LPLERGLLVAQRLNLLIRRYRLALLIEIENSHQTHQENTTDVQCHRPDT
jgi:hypothetical protein